MTLKLYFKSIYPLKSCHPLHIIKLLNAVPKGPDDFKNKADGIMGRLIAKCESLNELSMDLMMLDIVAGAGLV
jgi:hypothetical protein